MVGETPFRFASVDHWLEHAAPTLGQHNAEPLRDLGYGDREIEALAADQVIGGWPTGIPRR
jgi:crotonobetainyl-CoA:carnitine CoA-transferase CaiB-like acyl-CoA transferase